MSSTKKTRKEKTLTEEKLPDLQLFRGECRFNVRLPKHDIVRRNATTVPLRGLCAKCSFVSLLPT